MRKDARFGIFIFVFAASLAAMQAQPAEAFTFGRAFMGDLGNGVQASTQLLLTNRDPIEPVCDVLVIFHQGGTAAAPEILFNGDTVPDNFLQTRIPRGAVRKFRLTATEGLVAGAVLVAPLSPCNETSISGTGRFALQTQSGGLNELYSIAPNTPDKWLRNERCFAISTCFRPAASQSEPSNNLGVALTSIGPDMPAPPGTTLEASLFDEDGQSVGPPVNLPFNGGHEAFFPFDSFPDLPPGPKVLILCLFTPDSEFMADLTTIQVGTDPSGNVQFDAPNFTDGFKSGDTSAWTNR